MTNFKTELKAIVRAFSSELKAGVKTAEAIKVYATVAMDAGMTRADAAKALAVEIRAAFLAAKDADFLARLEAAQANGKDLTSLKSISTNIENRWSYVCRVIGFAADASNASKGSKGGKAATATGKQAGQAPDVTPPRAADTDSVTDTAASSLRLLKSKDARAELFSHVGTLAAKDRVAVALELLANLSDSDIAAVMAKMTARKPRSEQAA